MFKNFFLRTNYELFRKDYDFFITQKLNPEIYIDSEVLQKISNKEIKKSADILKKLDANTIHAPFYDISPGGFTKEIRDISLTKLKKILEIAKKWQSKVIVVHFNFYHNYYKAYFKKWLENATNFFSNLIKEGDTPLIALENISEPTPYVVLKLMEKINSDKIIHCFDFGHHNVFGLIPFEEWLFYLRPKKFIHFHFHDNHGMNDDHLPLGKGNIEWKKVKDVILNLNVNFSVALEPHSKKDLIKSVNFYRKVFL